MQVDKRQLARVLVEHAGDKSPENAAGEVRKFILFLADQGLLIYWREIEREIHAVWKELYGASNITILSAHELTENARKNIHELVPGAEVEELVDNRLIGGAVIRVDDARIDGSIAGTLRRLKTNLQT